MRYILKLLFLSFTILQLVVSENIKPLELLILLVYLCFNIFREKYNNSFYILMIELIVTIYLSYMNINFAVLFGIIAFDMIQLQKYYFLLPVYIVQFYFLQGQRLVQNLFLISISIFTSFLLYKLDSTEKSYKQIYDKERKYIYELENARQKLINSSKDLVYLTEVKERNRIAREIHDNIGHSIAGILMQLQAAYKIKEVQKEKSEKLIEKSIDGLSEALTIIRNTVHNIKPKENLGVAYIENIIKEYSFCDIDFKTSGDFNALSASHLELLISNIKEALTNASKYSYATKIEIRIDINAKFIRLYIKDNGRGCGNIKEGLGISGMKERIKNIGGSFSISSDNGFILVSLIPIVLYNEGGSIFENIDSR